MYHCIELDHNSVSLSPPSHERLSLLQWAWPWFSSRTRDLQPGEIPFLALLSGFSPPHCSHGMVITCRFVPRPAGEGHGRVSFITTPWHLVQSLTHSWCPTDVHEGSEGAERLPAALEPGYCLLVCKPSLTLPPLNTPLCHPLLW